MSRVLGAGIGDIFEGGQEQMHDGDGLQEDESTFRIHHEPSHKPSRSVRHGHMRFP